MQCQDSQEKDSASGTENSLISSDLNLHASMEGAKCDFSQHLVGTDLNPRASGDCFETSKLRGTAASIHRSHHKLNKLNKLSFKLNKLKSLCSFSIVVSCSVSAIGNGVVFYIAHVMAIKLGRKQMPH